MEKIILGLEELDAQLSEWLVKALDNERVSDGLYGFVEDIRANVRRELRRCRNAADRLLRKE